VTVEQIVAKVFGVAPGKVNDSSVRDNIEGWDSMGHLTLIIELEKQFRVNISISDSLEMVSIRKIKEVLGSYGVEC
jgi:acyl carrier protein